MTESRLRRTRNYNEANPQQKRGCPGSRCALGLQRQLDVAPEFMVVPNSGLVTDAVESGVVDVAFMPLDDERVGHTKWPPERGPFNLVRDRTCRT